MATTAVTATTIFAAANGSCRRCRRRVFTPEKLTDEHRLIGRTADEFVDNEVLPELDRLEQKDWALARGSSSAAATSACSASTSPEAYGGVGLDKVTSLVVSERMARSASFGATFGAQANLTVLPLFLFGTDAQKQKYLPTLLSGRAHRRLRPQRNRDPGSDALGARTARRGSRTAASC